MEHIFRILKFGIVGIIGMFIDFGITWVFKDKKKLDKYLANAFGFIFSVSNNYIVNRLWTFESKNEDWQTEVAKFLIVSLMGLGLNTGIIHILHQRKNGVNFYIAKLIAIGIVFIWNYTLNAFFTFN